MNKHLLKVSYSVHEVLNSGGDCGRPIIRRSFEIEGQSLEDAVVPMLDNQQEIEKLQEELDHMKARQEEMRSRLRHLASDQDKLAEKAIGRVWLLF